VNVSAAKVGAAARNVKGSREAKMRKGLVSMFVIQ
jgi:hypothetical protein